MGRAANPLNGGRHDPAAATSHRSGAGERTAVKRQNSPARDTASEDWDRRWTDEDLRTQNRLRWYLLDEAGT